MNGSTATGNSSSVSETGSPSEASSFPGDNMMGLLGGSDTVIPDTQHLGGLAALDPTLAQLETDANGVLANIGDLGANDLGANDLGSNDLGTATDIVPNSSGLIADTDGVLGPALSDAQGALNGTGTGGIIGDANHALSDAAAGNLNGAADDVTGALGNGSLSGTEGDLLGTLGNGSLADTSALAGGVAGSSPLLDANADPSQGSSVDVLAADQGGASGNALDADALPSSLGDVLDAGALASPQTGDGGVNVGAGDSPSLLSADALTGKLPGTGDLTNGSLNGTVDDTVNGLLNGSSSSNLVDANAGSQADSGNAADASVLTAPQSGDGALGAFVGDGSNIASANALTAGNDPVQSTLSSSGADSLVGTLTNDVATQTAAAAPAEAAPALNNVADVSTAAGNVDASQILSNVANTAQQATQHALI